MIKEQHHLGHSDLAPSSKDWQPGSTGRDEDFTPEKDLWTREHKGDAGGGRPGEDIQPGTAQPGKTWQSDQTAPRSEDEELDKEVEDTFPASDPPSITQPGSTGWDIEGDRFAGGRRSDFSAARARRNHAGPAGPAWPWIAALGLALLPLAFMARRTRH